jgi:hypothetical protein
VFKHRQTSRLGPGSNIRGSYCRDTSASLNRIAAGIPMTEEWPYDDPKNVLIITTKGIIERVKIVKYISHDDEDGMWQFHDGDNVIEQDARIISLEQLTTLDLMLKQLLISSLGGLLGEKIRTSHG